MVDEDKLCDRCGRIKTETGPPGREARRKCWWCNSRENDDGLTPNELEKQAERVESLVEATMYPVAHGEAERLKMMIEEYMNQNI